MTQPAIPSLAECHHMPGTGDYRTVCGSTRNVNDANARQSFNQFRPIVVDPIAMTQFAVFPFAPRVNVARI